MSRTAAGQTIRALFLASVLTGCGGGTTPTQPPPGGQIGTDFLRATIDGGAWVSSPAAVSTGAIHQLPGLYSITGIQVGSYTMALALYNIGAPGTYPLGVGPQVPGGSVVLSGPPGAFQTVQSGSDGTITITTLTDSRIAGTFSFVASPQSGSAAPRNVTQGEFSLPVKSSGPVAALPDNAGGKVSATINGAAFNAAAVAVSYSTSTGTLAISGTNNTRLVNLTLASVTGPGTYALSNGTPTRTLGTSLTTSPGAGNWSSAITGSSGTVVITSFTATRIKGTFTGTLAGLPGATPAIVSVTNGSFDVGRP